MKRKLHYRTHQVNIIHNTIPQAASRLTDCISSQVEWRERNGEPGALPSLLVICNQPQCYFSHLVGQILVYLGESIDTWDGFLGVQSVI